MVWLGFEVFEGESLIELVDITAVFVRLGSFFNVSKVFLDVLGDLLPYVFVVFRLINNIFEARTWVWNEAGNENVEIAVVNDTLNFRSDILHVLNELVKIVFNVNLSRLILNTVIIRLVKANNSLQAVLTVSPIHLSQDQHSTFKINANLTFNNHIVS